MEHSILEQGEHTVDGKNPANQLIWFSYPIIYRVFENTSKVVVWDF